MPTGSSRAGRSAAEALNPGAGQRPIAGRRGPPWRKVAADSEPLTSIKVLEGKGAERNLSSGEMEETEVRIEEIKAEIRQSIGRAKAMVAESERFVRDHSQLPPEPQPPLN